MYASHASSGYDPRCAAGGISGRAKRKVGFGGAESAPAAASAPGVDNMLVLMFEWELVRLSADERAEDDGNDGGNASVDVADADMRDRMPLIAGGCCLDTICSLLIARLS